MERVYHKSAVDAPAPPAYACTGEEAREWTWLR